MAKPTTIDVDGKEIVAHMMIGDEDALRTLLCVYGSKIKGWLWSRFGHVLQEPEIDQALTNAAFNAWRFADRFDDSLPLGAWLIGIAGNSARAILRGEIAFRSKHLEYKPDYDPAWYDEQEGDEDETTAASKERQERLRDLDQAIQRLAPLQRAVIEADIASGTCADDKRLAEIHKSTKNSIQVSRNKAIKNLRRIMGELGYDSCGRKVRP